MAAEPLPGALPAPGPGLRPGLSTGSGNATGALVVEEHDAVAEDAGGREAQADHGVGRPEHRLAPADQDRVDVDPVLVDEVEPPERLAQVGPAEHEVPAGLRLKPHDLLRHDLADHGRVPRSEEHTS